MKQKTNNKQNLTRKERNNICLEFMVKFGGLHYNKVNDGVEADKIMQWVISKIEEYRN